MVKSDFLNDILQQTPLWIIRWGNTLFLIFIITLLVLSGYIKYPDTLSARMELLTKNPPIEVKSFVEGKIDTLFFDNKSEIKSGDLIAKIHSTTNFKDIIILEKILNKALQVEKISDYQQIDFIENLQLGVIGHDYSTLLKEFKNLDFFLKQNYTIQKNNSLENEIKKNTQLNQLLKKQEEISLQEINISKINFERSKKLLEEKLISKEQVENIERSLLAVKRIYENAKIGQIENELEIERLRIQKIELQNNQSLEMNSQVQRIRELINVLLVQVNEWKESHLILAPISGIISYSPLLSQESPVIQGQVLFNIIPSEKNNKVIGICKMPIRNSGGVTIGNSVQIQLDAFPYQEYGILKAQIISISDLAQIDENNVSYNEIELTFPEGLHTIFGEDILFTQRMTGTALIVKEKRSLLERVFERVLVMWE